MSKIEKTSQLYDKIAVIIEQSRQNVATAVNLAMVYTYYEIGRYIVEDEQQGNYKAEFGTKVILELANKLTQEFGKGFSVTNLKQMRQFFLIYSQNRISQTPSDQIQIGKNQSNSIPQTVSVKLPFTLSWSHYLILMREENPEARRFYEIEAASQQWSVRQLAHQCASSLYERLALSRDKKEVMRLANEGQAIEKPKDVLKNPLVLNFLEIEENPTIGILLCKQKNDSIVELTLPKDANIYASQYSLYLPDKQLLQAKLAEWVEEFEEGDSQC